MKFGKSAICYLLFLVGASLCDIHEPSSPVRSVVMENTFMKILNYVKKGHHQKFRNTDSFINEHAGENSPVGTCTPGFPGPWKFGGFTVASLNYGTEKPVTWENHCFKDNSVTFKWIDSMVAELTFTAGGRKILGCSDTYALSTVTNFDVKVIDQPGTHVITYTFKSLPEVQYVNKMGLHVIRLCDTHVDLLPDFFLTALLFIADPWLEGKIGEKVPPAIRDIAY